MTYYDILGVSRLAEDAVIRAAYRALMRIYHPDTNADLQAQARVREINAAYAVLGNPSKRAQYDELPNLFDDPPAPEQTILTSNLQRHPLRNVGIGSIALLLVTSLAVIALPQLQQPFRSQEAPRPRPKVEPRIRAASALTKMRIAAPRTIPVTSVSAASIPITMRSPVTSVSSPTTLVKPIPPSRRTPVTSKEPISESPVSPKPAEVADAAPAPVRISTPALGRSEAKKDNPPQVAAACSAAQTGACANERKAQIERIATNFLRQSLEHSDWHKQQLLLSAQNRSTFSRASCQSDECVINAYMRQMRDTSVIMQGGIPNQ